RDTNVTRNRPLPVALRTENRMPPQRVINISSRQRRKTRPLPTAARRVGPRKVPAQRTQRPPVSRNVMQQQQQNMLATPLSRSLEHIQMRTQRKLAPKIKPSTRSTPQRRTKPRRAHRLNNKLNARRTRRYNLLPRHPHP